MGYLKYIRNLWKKPQASNPDMWKTRLIKWRKEPTTVKVKHPTRPDRARSLGYKAKQGVIIVRQRVKRGGHSRPRITKGRRTKHRGHTKIVGKSYQWIAEERANKKYPNCEVLNSYWVAQDGQHYWYEIIMVDRTHPSVKASKDLKRVLVRGRAQRGLTSAGKRSRGLHHKGKGREKIRPSLSANKRRAK